LLFDYHLQAWQTQFYTLSIGSNVLFTWFFIRSFDYKTKWTIAFRVLVIGVCLFNLSSTIKNNFTYQPHGESNYVSIDFLNKCSSILKGKSNPNVAFVQNNPVYPTVYPIGSVLLNINTEINFECIDLSILGTNNVNHKVCSFYQYSIKNKSSEGDETSQINFIKNYKIKYVVGKKELSPESKLATLSREIAHDELSGLYIREMIFEKK
jgi:hypothetical protein